MHLNAAVDDSGWKRTALAEHVGASPSRLTDMLKGERPMTLERLERFPEEIQAGFVRRYAAALGIDAAHILLTVAGGGCFPGPAQPDRHGPPSATPESPDQYVEALSHEAIAGFCANLTPTEKPTAGAAEPSVQDTSWRTVIDLDQRGRRLSGFDPIRVCPSCWPTHMRTGDVRITLDEPLRDGEYITCHWCDAVRRAHS